MNDSATTPWPGRPALGPGGEASVVADAPPAYRPRWAIPILLFVLTLASATQAGTLFGFATSDARDALTDSQLLSWGLSYGLPLLAILTAHEMGHYVAARVNRVRATLPYFIPFPPYFSIIGTVGAFIRLKGPTVRRAILFDVGASGPLASFVLSLPMLAIGLALSRVVPLVCNMVTDVLGLYW